jgi:hypothetical protein
MEEYLAKHRKSFRWLLIRSLCETRSFSTRFGGKMNLLPRPSRNSSDCEPIVYSLHINISTVQKGLYLETATGMQTCIPKSEFPAIINLTLT